MLRNLVASRGFVSILGTVVVAAVAAAGAFVLLEPTKARIDYCAIMPDSIGLYVGNDVTLRGVPVGTVSDIRSEGTLVRVDFRIDADHPLRDTVTATTVSDTIVADRRLAVNDSAGNAWNPSECVTQTATPKSITQTLDSLAGLADQLDGGNDPAARNTISAAVSAFDRSVSGTGPKMNDIITQLAAALRSPDAAIGRIGSLIDTLASLSQSVADGWGDLRTMLTGLSPLLQLVNQVWDQVVVVVDSIVVILPWLNDITTKYGGPILQLLDKTVPFLDLVAANVGTLEQLIDMIPAVETAFRTVIDPQTGLAMVSYAPPRVALDEQLSVQVCAATNAVAPGSCHSAETAFTATDLAALVFGPSGGVR
ncbi:MCE family protein [Antrihabitans sp. YC3-6]|uniref:MCE family protein n=1 Tax=Antrihabitans stalagmiti TaxID=2799499 RepID=A0A934U610_9NOCA|nr:MlaD family protein [Antrihabitans stalagmiti]MBJ8342016.1 MCE family protein [Antrihabitans stalagmiti]